VIPFLPLRGVMLLATVTASGCMSQRGDVVEMADGSLTATGDSRGVVSSLSKAHEMAAASAAIYCGQFQRHVAAIRFDDRVNLNEYATMLTFRCK